MKREERNVLIQTATKAGRKFRRVMGEVTGESFDRENGTFRVDIKGAVPYQLVLTGQQLYDLVTCIPMPVATERLGDKIYEFSDGDLRKLLGADVQGSSDVDPGVLESSAGAVGDAGGGKASA